MHTVLTASPQAAAEFIRRGGTVAFPTETVYGLGANVFDAEAIKKIFAAKKRPSDNPLIAHVAEVEQISLLVSFVTPIAEKLIAAFFPAPLTLVLQKSKQVPFVATAGLETIGVRMPRHNLALKFLRECSVPLVAPSANLSGKPSPTNWKAVWEDLNQRIDCILQGEQTEVGLESTVVDCTSDVPLVLRVGALALEDLRAVVPQAELASNNSTNIARSPGTRYKHYAPGAKVILISDVNNIAETETAAFIGINQPQQRFAVSRICSSVEEYARELFAFFRECDARQIQTIYCQSVSADKIGSALMDRITRAAN